MTQCIGITSRNCRCSRIVDGGKCFQHLTYVPTPVDERKYKEILDVMVYKLSGKISHLYIDTKRRIFNHIIDTVTKLYSGHFVDEKELDVVVDDISRDIENLLSIASPSRRDATEKPTECPICIEHLGDEEVLCCGHWFHEDCINTWKKTHETCPICRSILE